MIHDDTFEYPIVNKNVPDNKYPNSHSIRFFFKINNFAIFEEMFKIAYEYHITKNPSHVLVRILAVSDKYYELSKKTNPSYQRFHNIVSQLPLEIQMRISNLSIGENKDFVPVKNVDTVIKFIRMDSNLIC